MSALITFDCEGNIRSIDEGFTSLFGYTSEEIVGKKMQETILCVPDSTEFSAAMEVLVKGEKLLGMNRTTQLLHKDGSTVASQVVIISMGEGENLIFAYQVSKIQDDSCMMTFQTDGKIMSCSNGESIFQYSDNDVVQLPLDTLVPSISFAHSVDSTSKLESIRNSFDKHKANLMAQRRDGSCIPLGVSLETIDVGPHSFFRGKFVKLDLNKEALFVVDGHETILQSNADFVQDIFGYSNEDVDGEDISSLIPNIYFDQHAPRKKRRRTLSSAAINIIVSGEFVHKTLDAIPVSWSVVRFSEPPPFLASSSTSPLDEEGYFAVRVRRNPEPAPLSESPTAEGIHLKTAEAPLPPSFPSFSLALPAELEGYPYQVGARIGEGSYGTVFQAQNRITKETLAMKVLEKKAMKIEDIDRCVREAHILKKLNHPNIVRAYDVIDTRNTLYIFMEYVGGSDLKKLCLGNKVISIAETRSLFGQLVSAVDYCHSQQVIHRDIKHANILLTHEGSVKLIDFGLSNYCKRGKFLSTFCGSPAYAAPEMLLGAQYFGPEVDVWSLGVVLYSMLTGKLPFMSVRAILTGQFVIPESLPPPAVELLKMMLVRTEHRAPISKIISHPWLQGYIPNHNRFTVDGEIEKLSKFQTEAASHSFEGSSEFTS